MKDLEEEMLERELERIRREKRKQMLRRQIAQEGRWVSFPAILTVSGYNDPSLVTVNHDRLPADAQWSHT